MTVELFTTERMSRIFSPEAHVQAMLEFEAALAEAEAAAGVIPEEAARAIRSACSVELFDVAAIHRETRAAGTPVVPLVRRLTDLVPESARGFVHWGATSQDAIDTAMVLQAREGLDALSADLLGMGEACASLAERHAATPMAGRTLLQQALPVTFGLKAAHWLAAATRHLGRLHTLRAGLPLQFGGAVGTLAALGDDGMRIAESIAERLSLRQPDLPWHTDRDVLAEVVAALGLVAGTSAKVAKDVAMLAQTEVGEAREGAPGVSSTMPQKRNPLHAAWADAAARLALGSVQVVLGAVAQEHERAAGAWQAEWVAVPDAFRFTGSAVSEVRSLVEELQVDPDRMLANLRMGGGQIMAEGLTVALAPKVGRDEAYRLVAELAERAARDGLELAEAASKDERVSAALSEDEVRAALDPRSYLGSSEAFVARALERFRQVASGIRTTG